MRNARYDVVVAGGGAGGVGAAIGAARTGARVVLIERAPYLGGAATHSSVLTYCGFWTQAEPPLRCVAGVGGEVLAALAAIGLYAGPMRMAESGVVVALIDPEAVKIVLDRICWAAGVDVILHATIVGGDADGDRIRAVTAWDHAGTARIEGVAFVDASGESDLAFGAGAGTRYGDVDGTVQNGTLVMRFGGIDANAPVSRVLWEHAIRSGKTRGLRGLTKEHGLVVRLPGSNDVLAFLADESYDARDARASGDAERRGREQAWSYLEAIRTLAGHERAYLVATGPMIGTRESRHVVAEYRLTSADVEGAARFADTVALGGWPVEYHRAPGEPNVWRRIKGDGAYGIPLRSLRSATHANLFAAGRTIDADAYAFASARVMGTAFATGHAAGVAAAILAGGAPPEVPAVRGELQRQHALLELPRPERSPLS